jgi:hypothetical protein
VINISTYSNKIRSNLGIEWLRDKHNLGPYGYAIIVSLFATPFKFSAP